MLYLLLSITEFATKLVSALSGIVLAIIILVIIVTAKNKKSKEPLVPAKAKNGQDADTDCKDKKKKKSKKGKDKTGSDSENSYGAANESNNSGQCNGQSKRQRSICRCSAKIISITLHFAITMIIAKNQNQSHI